MRESLCDALDALHAGEARKARARARIRQRQTAKAARRRAPLTVALALCAVLIFGGLGLYRLPTTTVSIDINPSLELSVNRVGRVVGVRGINDDGRALADSLALQNRTYLDAVACVMQTEDIAQRLRADAWMTLTVVGRSDAQCARMLEQLTRYTAAQPNVCCYHAHAAEVEAAHDAGLSYGKYRAFLEVQALDPDAEPEDAQGMSMRELRDWLSALQTAHDAHETDGKAGHGSRHRRHRQE